MGLRSATHWLEKELAVMIRANPDFTHRRYGGWINYGPGISLMTWFAAFRLCRTVNFEKKGSKDRIRDHPEVCIHPTLKALALGCGRHRDRRLIGFSSYQLTKVVPWEPPTNLIFEIGPDKDKLTGGGKKCDEFYQLYAGDKITMAVWESSDSPY